jgi:hypothetical protein
MPTGLLIRKTQSRPLIWLQASLLAPDFERTRPNPDPDYGNTSRSQLFLDAFGVPQPFIECGG